MKKFLFFISFIFLFFNGFCQNTPEAVLEKAKSVILNSKGLSVDFTIKTGGNSGKGILKSMGDKFTVTMPGVRVWFNGKDLYTFNSRTDETTITDPTPDELAEVNPLEYLKFASKNFTSKFSSQKIAGCYVVDLIPKTRRADVKSLTITLRSKDFYPVKISGVSTSGEKVAIDITSFKTGVGINAAEFEYPESKYPNVEIVDLR